LIAPAHIRVQIRPIEAMGPFVHVNAVPLTVVIVHAAVAILTILDLLRMSRARHGQHRDTDSSHDGTFRQAIRHRFSPTISVI
jgi:hypothetical protein